MYTLKNGHSLAGLIKKEANHRTLKRLLALSMLYEKVPIEQILRSFKISRKTLIERWLKRWNQEGRAGLVNKRRSGRPPTLNLKQKELLKEYVLGHQSRVVCRELVDFVYDKWGIKCDQETIRVILISMKISWQKPNKQNYKSNQAAKQVFKKSTLKC